MARVLLIDPATPAQLAQRSQPDRLRRWRYTPHLGLQVLLGASDGHDVTIVDERIDGRDLSSVPADIVGITARTGLAPRAHALAREFHARGVPVVIGGPYATLSPELALQDPAVSSVVAGRAEGLWQQVLGDAAAGRLQRRYAGSPVAGMPRPRRDQPGGPYRPDFALVQVSQGCNFRCSFCVIPSLYDKQFLVPSVERALSEIASIPETNLFLVDDNLIGNLPFARRLFEGMKGMGKRWICQCTLNVALDRELLKLMREAGCRMLNMGLESLTPKDLRLTQNKKQNSVVQYEEAIRRVHEAGILVSGGFIFGFDHDDEAVFDRTLDFMWSSRIDFVACHILTPYPGTPDHARLSAEGRILTGDLGRYTTYDVVFRPARMSPERLQEGFQRVVREFYSWKGMARRWWNAIRDVDPVSAVASALTTFVTRANLVRGLPTHA
jgi:radical SAM superfamily enzyme YgiQ (UPF0313 family)